MRYYVRGGLIDPVSQRLRDIVAKAYYGGQQITKDDWNFMKSVAIPTGEYTTKSYANPKIEGRVLNAFYNAATPSHLYIAGFSQNNSLVCYAYRQDSDQKYKLYNRFQYEIKIS